MVDETLPFPREILIHTFDPTGARELGAQRPMIDAPQRGDAPKQVACRTPLPLLRPSIQRCSREVLTGEVLTKEVLTEASRRVDVPKRALWDGLSPTDDKTRQDLPREVRLSFLASRRSQVEERDVERDRRGPQRKVLSWS